MKKEKFVDGIITEKRELDAHGSHLVTSCFKDIKPRPIEWLWPERIALGKVTLIAGDPGLGKSMLTAALASTVSNGATWPVDGSECRRGGVIMLSAEDDPEDTIRPRLDAAGADITRVHCIHAVRESDTEKGFKDRSFNLVKDLDALDRMLASYVGGIDLVTIDPVSAYLGGTDSHNNADIRALLSPLAALASKHRVAVVAVTHLNKSAQANIMYRATGSLAFVAAARAVFAVVKDQDDPSRRLFLPIKNNLGDDRTGYAYTIGTAENDAPVIVWEPDAVTVTLEEMAEAVAERKQRPQEQAKEWLEDQLADGEVLQEAIKKLAEAEGYSWRTVIRAKKDLGIKSSKHRFDGKWTWSLPTVSQDLRYVAKVATSEECQQPPAQKVAPFGESGTLRDAKNATSNEECHIYNRGQVAHFGNGACMHCGGEGCEWCSARPSS